jgi:hypothetical protein
MDNKEPYRPEPSQLSWGGSSFSTSTLSHSGKSIHQLKQALHDSIEFGRNRFQINEVLSDLVSFNELLLKGEFKGRHPKVILTEVRTCVLHALVQHSISVVDDYWCGRIFTHWKLWKSADETDLDTIMKLAHKLSLYFSQLNGNYRLIESIMSNHYEEDLKRIDLQFPIVLKFQSSERMDDFTQLLYQMRSSLNHPSKDVKYQALYYGLKALHEAANEINRIELESSVWSILYQYQKSIPSCYGIHETVQLWEEIFIEFRQKPFHSQAKLKQIHKEKINDPKRFQLLCFTQAFIFLVEFDEEKQVHLEDVGMKEEQQWMESSSDDWWQEMILISKDLPMKEDFQSSFRETKACPPMVFHPQEKIWREIGIQITAKRNLRKVVGSDSSMRS